MTSTQLAIFKVPAVDNEPMVNNFTTLRSVSTDHHPSEVTVQDLWNEKGLKRFWLKWRKIYPLRFLA